MIFNIHKFLKRKLHNRFGFTLLELLIVIGIMSVIMLPAYMLLTNGQRIFSREANYQTLLRQSHAFFIYVNNDVRLSGFNKASLVIEDDYPQKLKNNLSDSYGNTALYVQRQNAEAYYIENDNKLQLIKFESGGSHKITDMVSSISGFEVSESSDDIITLSVLLRYKDRENTVTTDIYKRYDSVAINN